MVFYCDGALYLDGLVCYYTASFPIGVICVVNNDEVLDCFACFITGFVMQDVDVDVDKAIRVEWHKVYFALGRCEEVHPDHLLFSSPNVMAAFTQYATILLELTTQVLLVKGYQTVKNRKARLYRLVAIIRPIEVWHVRWALKHEIGLTVVGGGHSSYCLWPNVVSVDIGAFDQVHIRNQEGRVA